MSKSKEIETVIYERLPRYIIGTLMFGAVIINVANVIARHLFHSPFIWAEEVLIFIMIWGIFIGTIAVSHDRVHLKMDLIASAFPKGIARIICLITDFLTFMVCVVVILSSSQVVITLWNYDQRSVVAEIPMVIPHSAILICFALTAVGYLIRFVTQIRRH